MFPGPNRASSPWQEPAWQEPVLARVCSAHPSPDRRRHVKEHGMDSLLDVHKVLLVSIVTSSSTAKSGLAPIIHTSIL